MQLIPWQNIENTRVYKHAFKLSDGKREEDFRRPPSFGGRPPPLCYWFPRVPQVSGDSCSGRFPNQGVWGILCFLYAVNILRLHSVHVEFKSSRNNIFRNADFTHGSSKCLKSDFPWNLYIWMFVDKQIINWETLHIGR